MKQQATASYRSEIVLAASLMTTLMALVLFIVEAFGGEATTAPWAAHIRSLDAALARNDSGAAGRAWREAYAAALGSRQWEAMADVADAALRLGDPSPHSDAVARARRAYLLALFRARERQSLTGVLRVAEAFARLGDRSVVEQCLRVARDLAARSRDSEAYARVRALADGFTDQSLAAGGLTVEP